MERRRLLKFMVAVPIGMLAEEVMTPISHGINAYVEKQPTSPIPDPLLAGIPMGNQKPTIGEIVESNIFGPIIEEVESRVIPSLLISLAEKAEHPVADALTGTWKIGTTRLEFGVGSFTSFAFGRGHNRLAAGIGGGFLFILQRKFGMIAAFAAHSKHNFRFS